jgi:hypothetical protein
LRFAAAAQHGGKIRQRAHPFLLLPLHLFLFVGVFLEKNKLSNSRITFAP